MIKDGFSLNMLKYKQLHKWSCIDIWLNIQNISNDLFSKLTVY